MESGTGYTEHRVLSASERWHSIDSSGTSTLRGGCSAAPLMLRTLARRSHFIPVTFVLPASREFRFRTRLHAKIAAFPGS